MPNNLTEKSISEHGEELCCEAPHADYSEQDKLSLPPVLTMEQAQRMAEFMGFLADANRLRILSILTTKEMCVGDLAIALGMNESAVSHQLRTLRSIRLVNFRKQGRHVFYSLQDHHVLSFYHAVAEHLEEATD